MSTLKSYVRKSFRVKAIQITEQNMADVAEWCGGLVRQPDEVEWKDKQPKGAFIQLAEGAEGRKYIGTVGCWVIQKGENFRIFHDLLFRQTFEPDPSKVDRERILALVGKAVSEARYETKLSGSNRIISETTDRIMKIMGEHLL